MAFLKKLFKDKDKKVIYNLLIVLAVGTALLIISQTAMMTGGGNEAGGEHLAADFQAEPLSGQDSLENRMEEILSLVENAGQVRVLLNYTRGAEKAYAENITSDGSENLEEDSAGGTRQQNQLKSQSSVVTLKSKDGGEDALILFETAPKIEGVIIVAEGGGDVFVKDALIRAASGLLGVPSHKITVLKMKTGVES